MYKCNLLFQKLSNFSTKLIVNEKMLLYV